MKHWNQDKQEGLLEVPIARKANLDNTTTPGASKHLHRDAGCLCAHPRLLRSLYVPQHSPRPHSPQGSPWPMSVRCGNRKDLDTDPKMNVVWGQGDGAGGRGGVGNE